jgi:carbamoyltransferase
MRVLGISAYYHDAAAALVDDGRILLLRQAVPEVRAAARDLSGLRAAGFTSFRMAMPIWLKEKLFQKTLLRKEFEGASTRRRLGKEAAVLRASPEPRGQRLLPVALRGGRGADHGRRRRVDDDLRRDRPRQRLKVHKELHFPHSLGPALLGLHLLHRLQGQLRRVQGHGPRALRRAATRT